jgi:hypothetical protein
MTKDILNFKTFYRQLHWIYYTVLLSLIFLMTGIYFFVNQHIMQLNNHFANLVYLSIFGGILIYFFSLFIKKILFKSALNRVGIKDKLRLYMSFYTINLVIIEIYGIVNSLLFYNTANLIFLIFAAFAILLLLLMKPHTDKIIYLLSLNSKESSFIEHPEQNF